jgi:predicted DNA-binding protein with PD1-like motif
MRARKLAIDAERTWVLVFERGDEVMSGLSGFSRREQLSAARIQAIGALSDVTFGYFDWESKEYLRVEVDEQVEVLSLLGDVAQGAHGPEVHAHVVVGKRDGSAHGGHLLQAHVRPTLEVVVTEAPTALRKRVDPVSGLALIDPGQTLT